jgi:pyridoxal 5'-phosphate synthase pdxT subunit
MIVGVLALQGAFREHALMLRKNGITAVEVRLPSQLAEIDALIIPGGESTTITKLMREYGFPGKIKEFASSGKPVFGTCAGAIVLAGKVNGRRQMLLDLIDMNVRRNAYGRQIESREVDLAIDFLGKKPFRAVFIRAPQIMKIGPDVEPLATYQGRVILARCKNILVSTFHPELTGDARIHLYFVKMNSQFKV